MSATAHTLPARFLEGQVRVILAGCGGNGSQMLTGLAQLDRALRACGHPGGLHVIAFDGDRVSEANVGRQLFYPADVGCNKAEVLIHRLNLALGLRWDAVPEMYQGHTEDLGVFRLAPDLLITCVDSATARREIHRAITGHTRGSQQTPTYWLDLGNRQRDGQVILGEPIDKVNAHTTHSRDWAAKGNAAPKTPLRLRLPTVVEVFPELLDGRRKEDNRPSCSLAEALESQDLFINREVATQALILLSDLLRRGKVEYHGCFINLAEDPPIRRLPVPTSRPAAKEPTND